MPYVDVSLAFFLNVIQPYRKKEKLINSTMSVEVQQVGQMSTRLSTSDDLDLLFDGKDPILSDDLIFSLEGLNNAEDGGLTFTNTFDLVSYMYQLSKSRCQTLS